MTLCQECKAEIPPSAAACVQCGAAGIASQARELSPTWIRKFGLIEKAGGPKLPEQKKLKTGEQLAVMFNIWGFLFGPVYYLVKGMWKKAIVLTALGLVIVFAATVVMTMAGLDGVRATRFVIPAIFAIRATIDYYKKVVLNDDGWW